MNSNINNIVNMCNCNVRVCVSCRDSTKKSSSCPEFDGVKDKNKYKDMFNRNWMIDHVKLQPNKIRVSVDYVFCPTCASKNKAGFKPDVKKVIEASEKATEKCLGTFTFKLPNGTVFNTFSKTEFGKLDPDVYLTTDAEVTDNDNEDDSDDSDDSDEEEEEEEEDEEDEEDEGKDEKKEETKKTEK